jgi:acyl-CoA synthetase (AMP-forming)/AMP-acid ligase II
MVPYFHICEQCTNKNKSETEPVRTIDYFDKRARLHPDRTLLVDGKERRTYAEFESLTHRIAGAMLRDGLKPQEPVAILSANSAEALLTMLSLWRANAVWIPVNTRNALDANIEYLNYVRASWLFYQSSYAADAREMQRRVPTIRHMVCLDSIDGQIPSLGSFMLPAGSPRVPDLGHARGDDELLTAIIATGGTTGPAKGVRVLNRSWGTMLETICNMMPAGNPVFLTAAPLTHAAGPFTLAGIAMGATVVLHHSFDAEAVMGAIGEHRATHMFLPPTALYTMLAHPRVRDFDYSSMRHFLLAGSAVSPDKLRQAVEIFGPCMCQSYGQTECHLVATWLSPQVVAAAARGNHPQRLASCGEATCSVRVEIMDDSGSLLGVSEVGEIVARGGLVGGGYFELPAATEETWAHGWHHTGDVGRRDKDGFFYIIDRKKDMIVTGGFNVFPVEVEAAIMELPEVSEAAVIGVPDDKWGEAVTALVVPMPGKTVQSDAIITHCRARLGSVKAPKAVHIRDNLPRTSVGKPDKKAMRAEFWAGAERYVH